MRLKCMGASRGVGINYIGTMWHTDLRGLVIWDVNNNKLSSIPMNATSHWTDAGDGIWKYQDNASTWVFVDVDYMDSPTIDADMLLEFDKLMS